MPSQSPFRIELADEQRAVLEKRARTHTAPYWEVVRARIVLLASEGLANNEIAARLDRVVRRWSRSGASGSMRKAWAGWKIDRVPAGLRPFPPEAKMEVKDGGEGAGLRASVQERGSS